MSNYKLSLASKRLNSGKCQIKFTVTQSKLQVMYGYMLSEAGTTLREVVRKIEDQVKLSVSSDSMFHSHLYNLSEKQTQQDIVIFRN